MAKRCFVLMCYLVVCLLSASYSQEEQTLKRLNQRVKHLYGKGDLQQGVVLAKKAYQRGVSGWGEKHPETLKSMNNLAGFYCAQEKFSQAESLLLRCLRLRKEVFGEGHPGTITTLHNLAKLYYAQGKFEQAISIITDTHRQAEEYLSQGKLAQAETLFVPCFQLAKEMLGEEHPEVLALMNNLASLYQSQGKFQEAESLYEQALKSKKDTLGPKQPSTLASMNNLAQVYQAQGKLEQAEPLFVRSLELRREVLGARHPGTIVSMGTLAHLYKVQGKVEQAESLLHETLELAEAVLGKQHHDTLALMDHLGGVHTDLGEYEEAERRYNQCLKLKRKVLGELHPDTLTSLNNLANLYRAQGKYKQAERLLQQSLQHKREILGERHPTTINSMSNLALVYISLGKFSQAEHLYLKVLELAKQVFGKVHPKTLRYQGNLASLYESMGELAKAESLYNHCLPLTQQTLGAKHPQTIDFMNNLAGVYRSQGKWSQAKILYMQALKLLSKEKWAERHPVTLTLLNNLALIYHSQKEFAQARSLLDKLLQQAIKMWGKKHPDTLVIMGNLAVLYQYEGKLAQAQDLQMQSLKLTKQVLGKTHPNTLTIMHNLALLYSLQGKSEQAFSIFQEYLTKKHFFLVRELQGVPGGARLKMLQNFRSHWDRNHLFSFLAHYPREEYNRLALYFLSNYKGILLRISQELQQAPVGKANKELVKQISQKRSTYSRLSLDHRSRQQKTVLLNKLEQEIAHLEKQLLWQNPQAQRLLSDTKPEKIVAALSPKDLLIDFTTYRSLNFQNLQYQEEKLVAVLASRGKIELVHLGPLQEITSLVRQYRKKLQQPHNNSQQLAQKIYQAIFVPLQEHLHHKNKLYLVPDGILHLLPFPSLQDQNGKYLAQNHNIVILSSSRDLLFFPEETNEATPPAIFAYPEYGKKQGKKTVVSQSLYFPPLPGTQQEVQAIAQILDLTSTNLYTKKQASKEKLVQLKAPQILHIATHGYFSSNSPQKSSSPQETVDILSFSSPSLFPTSPLTAPFHPAQSPHPLVHSGLALAGANHPQQDGILTALEVLSLPLHGTKLVVLSACETGVGKIHQGEGVYSLQRAFREAGAHTVLASLWKVDDQATRIFMQKFYQHYQKGISAQKAVKQTQLEFIQSPHYSHPFYWSAFVAVGGPFKDLPQAKPPSLRDKTSFTFLATVVSLMGVISVFIIWFYRKKQQAIVQERKARQTRRQLSNPPQ